MAQKYEDKKARLKRLFEQQEEIEAEIKSLLEPEKVQVLPTGFSLSAEVFKIIQNAGGQGISLQEILQTLQKQYPSYGIERAKIASALAYGKNEKKILEQFGRGVYRMKTETPSSEGVVP